MKKKKSPHVVFKPYTMGQLQLPTDLEMLIPPNHLVRVVHDAIEKMDLSPLLKQYKGGGKGAGVCLYPADLFIPTHRQSAARKCQFHVDQREQQA